jgi:glycosyltransferase involved in cell wall biosynthesis
MVSLKILMLNSAVYDRGFADVAAIHTGPLASELAANHQVCIVGQVEELTYAGENLSVKTISAPLGRWAPLSGDHSTLLASVHRAAIVLSILHIAFGRSLRERFHVIYARHGLASIAGALLSWLTGIPMVLELNGLLSLEAQILERPKAVLTLTRLIETFVLQNTDHVVAVTPELKNQVCSRYRFPTNSVSVVTLGVDTRLFQPKNKARAREECHITAEIPLVCFVGNFMPWHGLTNLVECAPEVIRKFPRTLFVLVGDGPQKSDLLRLVDRLKASQNFRFPGTVPHRHVPDYVNAADVCVIAFTLARNQIEGLSPLKLYEYMACGRPIVASAVSTVAETLGKYRCGVLVQPDDPHSLAQGIIRVLEDCNIAVRLGEKARKVALEYFSWRDIAQKISRVLETFHEDSVNGNPTCSAVSCLENHYWRILKRRPSSSAPTKQ